MPPSRVDNTLVAGLKTLPQKPPDTAPRSTKQSYSQKVSGVVADAFAEEFRQRGLDGSRPAPPGVVGGSGAERRMAGGLGAKKVDVTWSTEESGLLVAISVKTINFVDRTTGNYQKNLTNRRGDMLFESVTLHRRFPYAVLGGFLFLDKGAASDQTGRRHSTFENAHPRFRLFTGRDDPAGRDEQYERLYIVLLDSNPFTPSYKVYPVGDPKKTITLDSAFTELIELIAERNPDFYEAVGGDLKKLR
jgi:hypothetical protein